MQNLAALPNDDGYHVEKTKNAQFRTFDGVGFIPWCKELFLPAVAVEGR